MLQPNKKELILFICWFRINKAVEKEEIWNRGAAVKLLYPFQMTTEFCLCCSHRVPGHWVSPSRLCSSRHRCSARTEHSSMNIEQETSSVVPGIWGKAQKGACTVLEWRAAPGFHSSGEQLFGVKVQGGGVGWHRALGCGKTQILSLFRWFPCCWLQVLQQCCPHSWGTAENADRLTGEQPGVQTWGHAKGMETNLVVCYRNLNYCSRKSSENAVIFWELFTKQVTPASQTSLSTCDTYFFKKGNDVPTELGRFLLHKDTHALRLPLRHSCLITLFLDLGE